MPLVFFCIQQSQILVTYFPRAPLVAFEFLGLFDLSPHQWCISCQTQQQTSVTVATVLFEMNPIFGRFMES